jgi:hypothetical protein
MIEIDRSLEECEQVQENQPMDFLFSIMMGFEEQEELIGLGGMETFESVDDLAARNETIQQRAVFQFLTVFSNYIVFIGKNTAAYVHIAFQQPTLWIKEPSTMVFFSFLYPLLLLTLLFLDIIASFLHYYIEYYISCLSLRFADGMSTSNWFDKDIFQKGKQDVKIGLDLMARATGNEFNRGIAKALIVLSALCYEGEVKKQEFKQGLKTVHDVLDEWNVDLEGKRLRNRWIKKKSSAHVFWSGSRNLIIVAFKG